MTTGLGVKGLLLDGDDALVLRKPDRSFDLLGGRLEEGEQYKDCLAREVWEETGLTNVEITNCLVPWSFLKSSGLIINGTTYVCLYLGGRILLSPEHAGFEWVPLNQLREMEIYWKYGLDKFGFDFIEKSSERREAYGGLESRRIASGNGGRI